MTARSATELDPIRERLIDQTFALSRLVHKPVERAVDLVLRKPFPPHKGTWALRIAGVRAWKADHRKEHAEDTLKEIRVEGGGVQGWRIVLRCVLDEYVAEVETPDLRLVRTDADDPAGVAFNDLPAWFRAEVQQKFNEVDREEKRIVEVGRRVRLRAAAGGAAIPFVLGLFTGGSLLALLLLTAPASGFLMYLLSGSKVGRFPKGIASGLGATAVCFAAGGVAGLFFTPLLLISAGIFLQMWVEQMRDMEV